jgi:hypothetical protein
MSNPYYKYKLLLFCFLFLLAKISLAQKKHDAVQDSLRKAIQDSLENKIDDATQVDIYFDYMNRVIYAARDFGIKQSGYVPGIQYKNKNGISLYLETYFLTGMPRKLFETDIGLAWEKELFEGFTTDIGYERWIINDKNKTVRRSLSNALHLGVFYRFDYFVLSSYDMYMFGKDKSASFSLQAMGNFPVRNVLTKNDKLYFQPLLRYNAGSAYSPIASYQIGQGRISGNKNGRGKKKTSGSSSATATSVNNDFGTLDYEAALQLTYKYKKLEITPQYIYAFPVDPSPENPQKPFGYFEIEVMYKFLLEK